MATAAVDRGREAPDGRRNYEFALLFAGIDELTEEVENRLFAGGCSDATFGIHAGAPYLAFDRESDSLAAAINSAINDVASAMPGLEVVRVLAPGEETISLFNAWLKLRGEVSRSLPPEMAYKVDEIMKAVGAHNPAAIAAILSPKG